MQNENSNTQEIENNDIKFFTNKNIDDLKNVDLEEVAGFTLLVDKPVEWTSFDVVNKLKGVFKIKKIGHAGTLDPFATGLLIVCVKKKATKTISTYQDKNKRYTALVELGKTTDSYDIKGEITETKDVNDYDISEEKIREVVNSFLGEITQIPPMFSALKVNGKRLYKLAREGITVERKERHITIYEIANIEILDKKFISFEVRCSKGTYIRTLADDIGRKLGCGAYLKDLRRTAIGEHLVDHALGVEELIGIMKGKRLGI